MQNHKNEKEEDGVLDGEQCLPGSYHSACSPPTPLPLLLFLSAWICTCSRWQHKQELARLEMPCPAFKLPSHRPSSCQYLLTQLEYEGFCKCIEYHCSILPEYSRYHYLYFAIGKQQSKDLLGNEGVSINIPTQLEQGINVMIGVMLNDTQGIDH